MGTLDLNFGESEDGLGVAAAASVFRQQQLAGFVSPGSRFTVNQKLHYLLVPTFGNKYVDKSRC